LRSHCNCHSPYPLGANDLINFKGEPFPFTPKWSVQYGARYDWDIGSNLKAYVSAEASYQGKEGAIFGSREAIADGAPRHSQPKLRVG
jgi:hypothetical protein